MIREIQREIGSSLLFVTHDLAVHTNFVTALGVMAAGRLVEEGATAELLRTPRHPYTAHLVASLPRIGDTAPKASLSGAPPDPGRFPQWLPLQSALSAGHGHLPPREAADADDGSHPSRRLLRRAMTKPLLELDDVSRVYSSGGLLAPRRVRAVDGVSFTIAADKPEIFAIIGEFPAAARLTLARMISEHRAAKCRQYPVPRRGAAPCLAPDARVWTSCTSVQPIFQNPFEAFNPLRSASTATCS